MAEHAPHPKALPSLLGELVADALLPVYAHILATGRLTLLRNARGPRRAMLVAGLYPPAPAKTWTVN